MNLILIGCEYTGTTTLAHAINEWVEQSLGFPLAPLHDHWKYPHVSGHPPGETVTNLTNKEMDQLIKLTPKLKELFMRYTIYYHTLSYRKFGVATGSFLVGYHFDEAIYGPMYLGYGDQGAPGDREALSKDVENHILKYAPDTVLILLKASPKIISQRMKEKPHQHGLLQETDIKTVLSRFEGDYESSQIRNKFTLDTSVATVEETLAEFVNTIEPYLTSSDRLRMATKSL